MVRGKDALMLAGEVYRCPGEEHAISREAHLARLAGFYVKCSDCPHSAETGAVPAKMVESLRSAARTRRRGVRFDETGASGVYPHEIDRSVAANLGAALGAFLHRTRGGDGAALAGRRRAAPQPPAGVTGAGARTAAPAVVVGRDVRHSSAELALGVADGLRFAGCRVLDVGLATEPSVAFAVAHLQADGGVLVGGAGEREHLVALRFIARGGLPVSARQAAALRDLWQTGFDRPVRRGGPFEAFRGSVPYLGYLLTHFHALRPLRVAALVRNAVVERYAAELFGNLAVTWIALPAESQPDVLRTAYHPRVLPEPAGDDRWLAPLGEAVRRAGAHVGALIDADARRVRITDEQGVPLEPEWAAAWLGRHVTSGCVLPAGCDDAGIVVERETPARVREWLRRTGVRATWARKDTSLVESLLRRRAVFAGGPSGRYWFGPTPECDALRTLGAVLQALSQSDASMSQLLGVLLGKHR